MASRAQSRIPKTVGVYTVADLLGKGGMGEVYLAHHKLLERDVALKRFMLRSPDGGEEEAKERFLREGRALARLNHHNIVGIYDLFERGKSMYMALEYIEGMDLSRLINGAPLPYDVAAIIGQHVAQALENAHHAGIVHRDVKSSNVMLSKRGEVKLTDFGIARQDLLEPMTKTGLVVGTPMYVAPEVIRGEEASAQSDIYALGALLYYALSGRRLFAHANPDNLMAMIIRGKFPRLSRVSKGVPYRLRSIVTRCLETKPERRFRSASEARQALELFLAGDGVWTNHAERLVAYLGEVGELTDDEVKRWLDTPEVSISRSSVSPGVGKSWAWLSLGLVALGISSWWMIDLLGGWARIVRMLETLRQIAG